jgi:hypothetical protein
MAAISKGDYLMDRKDQLSIKNLRPYISISIISYTGKDENKSEYAEHLEIILQSKILEKYKGDLKVNSTIFNPITFHGWYIFGYWYTVLKAPNWLKEFTSDPSIYDVRNHLALIMIKNTFTAIVCTDLIFRKEITNYIVSEMKDIDGNSVFSLFSKEIYSNAFLRGEARQTWLQGMHRPIRSKPDFKIMTGLDLRDTIDPFSDQTYSLNAALSDIESSRIISDYRARLPENSSLIDLDPKDAIGDAYTKKTGRLLGVSFKDGIIWTRSSRNIDDFLYELDKICTMITLASTTEIQGDFGYEQQGYNMLQRPTHDIQAIYELGEPIDFYLDIDLPPETDEGSFDQEYLLAIHEWQEHGEFKLSSSDKERVFVDVFYDGRKFATLRIQPLLLLNGEVKYNYSILRPSNGVDLNLLDCLDKILKDFQDHVSLWYKEGYAIRQGLIFRLIYRDVPYNNWCWIPLKRDNLNYKASKEKPDIRLLDHNWYGDSLFDFVVRNVENLFGKSNDWHLMCDDGSGEIADFIYIDGQRKMLRLVHVKGAGKAETRDIAPAKFEIVVSQATKNLRFLEPKHLLNQLKADIGSPIEKVTWKTDSWNKNFSRVNNRIAAIAALQNIGAYPDKAIVILQPHIRRTVWDIFEENLRLGKLPINDRIQLLRLKTMIVDLEEACKRFEANLIMLGENDNLDNGKELFSRSSLL